MKRIVWILSVILVCGVALVWGVEQRQEAGPAESASNPEESQILLSVPSMTCGSCEGRIRAALDSIAGVNDVEVDLRSRTVQVRYRTGAADAKTLADAVTRAGYPARYLPAGSSVSAPEGARGGCAGGCCAERG